MLKKTGEAAETVSEVVFRQIRQDIISGILPPGSKIKLEQARERYSISVSPLREILSRLTTENLVVAEGQKGFEVSPASRRELLELADLRVVLETHALDLAFAAGDLEWEASIVAAHHKLAAAERGFSPAMPHAPSNGFAMTGSSTRRSSLRATPRR